MQELLAKQLPPTFQWSTFEYYQPSIRFFLMLQVMDRQYWDIYDTPLVRPVLFIKSINSQRQSCVSFLSFLLHYFGVTILSNCNSSICRFNFSCTLPSFNSSPPKKLPKPNRKGLSSSPTIFAGAMLNFGGVHHVTTWAPTWCLITGLGCVDHIRSMMFVKTSICPSPKFSRHQSKVWHDNMAI